jgi:hypothetical protein
VLFCLVLCIEFDRSEVVVLFLFLLQVVFFFHQFCGFWDLKLKGYCNCLKSVYGLVLLKKI